MNKRSLESSISAGALPILTSLAETPDGQILNVNADVAASELAAAFQPLKVVYLNTTCGMIDPTTKKKIDIINLDEEYQELLKQPWMKFGARLKLEQIHDMLMKLPSNHSVAITSAQHLSKELFTHSGSGTLIRRGHGITRHKSLKSIDERLLTSLLSLDPTFSSDPEAIGEFLNSLPEDSVIYTDASYQSCAVVQPANHEFPYPVLTKFVHTEAASLENTHTQLMMAIKKDFSQLIWAVERGAKESWWYEMSDGSISRNNLRLFWTGIDNLTQVPERYPGVVGSIPNGVLITPQSRNYSTKRVALIGARGHTGQELITLISNHPEMILTHVSSRELKGQTVDAYTKNPDLRYTSLTPEDVQKIETAKEVDAWVLALPNNLSTPFVEAITQDSTTHSVIVDLSADHRFRPDWTYGLPELNRSISWGRKIANPGCYATAAQLCIFPFLKYLDATVRPVVVAVSGYSGAGTKPSPNNDPGNVRDNLIWYSQTGHIHEREVSSRMKTDIWFTPAVGGWFRGIGMSVQLGISEEYAGRTIEQWREVLESTYQGESLIKISEAPPAVKGIANQHYAMVGGLKLDKSGRRLVVTGTIDNLLKGAATQAMQVSIIDILCEASLTYYRSARILTFPYTCPNTLAYLNEDLTRSQYCRYIPSGITHTGHEFEHRSNYDEDNFREGTST